MAAAAEPASKDGGNNDNGVSSRSLLFVDDDEETLSLLLQLSDNDDNNNKDVRVVKERLPALVERFRNDHSLDVWKNCVTTATTTRTTGGGGGGGHGFSGRYDYHHHHHEQNNSQNQHGGGSEHNKKLPTALSSSEAGKLHLQAVGSILGVSPTTTAAQLTLGALSSNTSGSNTNRADGAGGANVSSLLGTLSLLLQTIEYYYRQRAARLSVIAELLRTEDDNGNNNNNNAIMAALERLDATVTTTTTTDNGRPSAPRGLLARLLSAAFQSDVTSSLPPEAHVHVRNLLLLSGNNNNNNEQDNAAWRPALRQCLNRQRTFQNRERVEALEALLVLLYQRVHVQRTDFAILWVAATTTTTNQNDYTNYEERRRMEHLTSLLLAESMALWRIFADDDDDDDEDTENTNNNNNGAMSLLSDWTSRHPMLEGLSSSEQGRSTIAMNEIMTLESLVRQAASTTAAATSEERLQVGGAGAASLGLLALGLLLNAAGAVQHSHVEQHDNDTWRVLGSTGFEMAKLANDEYNAIGLLHSVMEHMVTTPPSRRSPDEQYYLLPSDLLYIHGDDETENPKTLLLEGDGDEGSRAERSEDSSHELHAPALAYASIGRELLSASLLAFQDNILPTHKLAQPQNVNWLSNLVAVIFRNSPTLCQRFWSDWDIYTSNPTKEQQQQLPLCRLLHASCRLGKAALEARGCSDNEQILCAITPLLQIAASLAYSSDIVEEELVAIELPELIQSALLLLSNNLVPVDSDASRECRKKVVDSICLLTKIGNSSSCRNSLRASIHMGDVGVADDESGPRHIMRVLTTSKDPAIVESVFTLLAYLFEGASFEWQLDTFRALRMLHDEDVVWRKIFAEHGQDARAVVALIETVAKDVGRLLFSSFLDETVAGEVLSVLKVGVLSSCEVLRSCLSTAGRKAGGGDEITYSLASLVMDSLSTTFERLRAISVLHKSSAIQSTAKDFLGDLFAIVTADRGLGHAISLFATAPVSLSLAASASVAMSTAHGEENTGSMFRSVRQDHGPTAEERIDGVRSAIIGNLSDLQSLALAPEDYILFVDESDSSAPLRAALSALSLMNIWGRSVQFFHSYESESKLQNSENADLLGFSPFHLLCTPVSLPDSARTNSIFSSAWLGLNVPVLTLLTAYIRFGGDNVVETSLASKTLELMSITILHAHSAAEISGETAAAFFGSVAKGSFSATIQNILSKLVALSTKVSFSASEKLEMVVGLRYLHTVGSFMDSNPSAAIEIVGRDKEDVIVESLLAVVKNGLSIIMDASVSESSGRTLADSLFVSKVRAASQCLRTLLAIWKHKRASMSMGGVSTIRDRSESDSDLLTALTTFLLSSATPLIGSLQQDQGVRAALGAFLYFTSLTVGALEIEASSANFQLLEAMDRTLNGNQRQLIDVTNTLSSVRGLLPFALALKSLSASLDQSPFTHFNAFALGTLLRPLTDSFSAYNFFYEDSVKSTLASTGGDVDQLATAFGEVQGMYYSLTNEIRLFQAWKKFMQTWLCLDEESSRNSPASRQIPGGFALSTALKLLHQCRDCLNEVQQAYPDAGLVPVVEDKCLLIVEASSGFLTLSHSSDFNNTFQETSFCDLIKLLSEIVEKLVQRDLKIWLPSITHLLALAASVSNSSVGRDASLSQDFGLRQHVDNAYANLALSVCKFVKALQNRIATRPSISNCLQVSIAVLECVIPIAATQSPSSTSRDHFVTQIAHSMEKYNVVRTLIDQAESRPGACSWDEYSTASWEIDIILPVLGLLTKMATAGDTIFLSLLISNASAALYSSIRRQQVSSHDASLRGYLKLTPGNRISATIQDDPSHVVWCASLKFLAVSLRSASWSADEKIYFRVYKLATDFINENRETIRDCLQECCSIEFGPNASNQHYLTRNLLSEASAMLEVLHELCRKEAGAPRPVLFDGMINRAASLVSTLSTYLGASASSRDIFLAMADRERSDDMNVDQGLQFAALTPAHRLAAGNTQNAKHEAIRFSSHFVLKSSRAVTEQDIKDKDTFPDRWQSPESDHRYSQQSLESLEKKCRSGVTNRFAFLIELEASRCLYLAINILRNMHPASASFVAFSEEEAAQLDAFKLRLVKPSMRIAFRALDFENRLTIFGVPEEEEDLQFAVIQNCDTVKRQWKARIVGSHCEGQEVFIRERQLAGIEDASKRVNMTLATEAPENSSSLDSMRALSMGHLILALRWCSQFSTEKLADFLDSETHFSVARLAESASALLGLELNIKQELRSRSGVPFEDSHTSVLADQILDLFGSRDDFLGLREGRLNGSLSEESWNESRHQLRSYIEIAASRLASTSTAPQNRGSESGTLFLRHASDGDV